MLKNFELQTDVLPYLLSVLVSIFLSAWMTTASPATDLGLSEADCRCCHGTTLADRHHLLVNTSGRECLSCHTFTFNNNTLGYEITVTRDCIQCHTGSLADRHHLLVDQVTYDCFTCHAIVWDPVELQYVADFNNYCPSPTPVDSSGTVAGTITDQSGTELGWVNISTTEGNYSTLATATGSYELPGMTPGNYTLVASLDGYAGASQDVTVADGERLSINFVLSPLPAPATISGVVYDINQSPLEGVSITTADSVYSTLSAADGFYSLSNVAEGNLELSALKNGYNNTSQSVSVTSGQNLTLDFTLSATMEICTDGIDNDSNGLIDCDDTICIDSTSCQTLVSEICDDNLDNDDNGLIDCNDPICIGETRCDSPLAEQCDDQRDNNGDGLLDCDDPLCNTAINCLPELCNDGIDNNADGLIDCNDPVCIDTSICLPPPVEICDDNLDNDDNGSIDCNDEKCANLASCVPPMIGELCRNGIDDNNDGFIDCADAKCKFRSVCLDEICNNELDDDADGRVDCEDRECRTTPDCPSPIWRRPLDFSASASGEIQNFVASNVGDSDPSTRWWINENGKQWLKLDLGGIYPVNTVNIRWHLQYANRYRIRISRDGRHWRTVKRVINGDGLLDRNRFIKKHARYVLIDLRHSVNTGYSIREVKIIRSNGY